MAVVFGLFVLLLSLPSQARVFVITEETAAAYLRGIYQLANQGKDPYQEAAGTNISVTDKPTANTAYDFGFVYAPGRLNLRFGFEIFNGGAVQSGAGTNASGTEVLELDHQITGYTPKIGLEWHLFRWPQSRVVLGFNYGPATVTVKNRFVLNATGQAAFPPLTTVEETIKGTGTLWEGALGYESLLSDTTTFFVEVGYRDLHITKFTHQGEGLNFQGAYEKGDDAYDRNNTLRKLNLSGGMAAAGIRIWLK